MLGRYEPGITEQGARNWLNGLPDWHSLRAVQSGQVRFIPAMMNDEDAYNSRQLLDQFADLG